MGSVQVLLFPVRSGFYFFWSGFQRPVRVSNSGSQLSSLGSGTSLDFAVDEVIQHASRFDRYCPFGWLSLVQVIFTIQFNTILLYSMLRPTRTCVVLPRLLHAQRIALPFSSGSDAETLLQKSYAGRVAQGKLDEDKIQQRVVQFLSTTLGHAVTEANSENRRSEWVLVSAKQTLAALVSKVKHVFGKFENLSNNYYSDSPKSE